jgi:hypothetical protein
MRRRGGRGPSYVVGFMNLALCGDFTVFEACATSKLCILGIQHMFWPTCKAMVVVLSHPLKRLSAISMLSIYGPAWSITTLPDNGRG